MGVFYIDTSTGAVATVHQLVAAGVTDGGDPPPRPWLRIQASGDATTLWHAIMRTRERGIWIGTLVMRHGTHHELLQSRGWEEIAVDDVGLHPSPPSPNPFS
jgi:hypothetical protein